MSNSSHPVAIDNAHVMLLIRAIVSDDFAKVEDLIRSSPGLSRQSLAVGATRKTASEFYFQEINHYLISGDAPLHAAAAGYRREIAKLLVKKGADVSVRNRRGAEPLHYASDGNPGVQNWNSKKQVETIAFLISAGANPNALDNSGVGPLHRAVRQRCSKAVDELIRRGSNVRRKNKGGSTPLHLAVQNTGRGGTGSPESKALQREIIERLINAGADPKDRDGSGRTVLQCVKSDWILALL
ncbi:MAG: ankyrin repeat domain-containing protein [Thaumarchaeota archaeon]|nr:ankyrin repeat domain-containing protein [Nitrososphaerota archaeon]